MAQRSGPNGVSSRGRCVNKHTPSADQDTVDVLPYDITVLPHVLGRDLIDYLTSTSAAGTPDGWDPSAEAADVIDPSRWYTTSFDANPEQSLTRWLPPSGSGLPTVAVCSRGSETTVLIRYDSPGPSSASARRAARTFFRSR